MGFFVVVVDGPAADREGALVVDGAVGRVRGLLVVQSWALLLGER